MLSPRHHHIITIDAWHDLIGYNTMALSYWIEDLRHLSNPNPSSPIQIWPIPNPSPWSGSITQSEPMNLAWIINPDLSLILFWRNFVRSLSIWILDLHKLLYLRFFGLVLTANMEKMNMGQIVGNSIQNNTRIHGPKEIEYRDFNWEFLPRSSVKYFHSCSI